MGEKGLFPLRSHKGKKFNIFLLAGDKYEGRIFDRYRRVEYKTSPLQTIDDAIKICRWVAEILSKGQQVYPGLMIHVDEGKDIREKEDAEYINYKKEMRKHNGSCGVVK